MPQYQIQQGDTLSQLAQQNNTTVEQIMSDNPNITNADQIQAGANLNIYDSNDIRRSSAISSAAARKDINGIVQDVNNDNTPRVVVEDEPKSERERIRDSLSALEEDQEDLYSGYNKQLNRIAKNGIKFSREEQKMIDDITDRFDGLRRRQTVANQSQEQGLDTVQARSGLARYGSELADLEIQQTAQQGIDRLKDIEIESESSLRSTMDAIRQGRIDGIEANYEQYRQTLNDRRDTLSQLRLNLNDAESAVNSGRTSDMKEFIAATEAGFTGDFFDFKKRVAQSTNIPKGTDDDDDEYKNMFGEDGSDGDIPDASDELKKLMTNSFSREQLSDLAVNKLGLLKKVNLRGKRFDENELFRELGRIAKIFYDKGFEDEDIIIGLQNPEIIEMLKEQL